MTNETKNEIDDGVIKFEYELDSSTSLLTSEVSKLEAYRFKLYQMNLIGEYKSFKVGFGNISERKNQDKFIISGTQTGKYSELKPEQYSLIFAADLEAMKVSARGFSAPSSESLTHYAIYHTCKKINYIFHIHHNDLWNFMLKNSYTATDPDINYGSYQMAQEAKRCIADKENGIFVMSGHEDGIIAYAQTAEAAYNEILELIKDSGIKL